MNNLKASDNFIDIAICIDGTNSVGYKNSFVRNFKNKVKAAEVIFHEGPENGITGSDSAIIKNYVVKELSKISKKYKARDFIEGYTCSYTNDSKFRIVMVGHSRGGRILIDLAQMFRFRIHFMGLYDAVSRVSTQAFSDDSTKVIYNVNYIAHAFRASKIKSRTYFGNTGLQSGDGGTYVEKHFLTSHGGIGGDTLTSQIISIPGTDSTCAITLFDQDESQVKTVENCIIESHEADLFIKLEARKNGIKI